MSIFVGRDAPHRSPDRLLFGPNSLPPADSSTERFANHTFAGILERELEQRPSPARRHTSAHRSPAVAPREARGDAKVASFFDRRAPRIFDQFRRRAVLRQL